LFACFFDFTAAPDMAAMGARCGRANRRAKVRKGGARASSRDKKPMMRAQMSR